MNAVTAEFEVRHHCQRQSVLKKEKHLSSSVEPNVEHCTLTNTCMQSAGLAWNASQKDGASGESEHARVQRWVHNDLKESGCASSMTNFEFCRDRPHSMELPTLVLMYSWCNSAQEVHPVTSENQLHCTTLYMRSFPGTHKSRKLLRINLPVLQCREYS